MPESLFVALLSPRLETHQVRKHRMCQACSYALRVVLFQKEIKVNHSRITFQVIVHQPAVLSSSYLRSLPSLQSQLTPPPLKNVGLLFTSTNTSAPRVHYFDLHSSTPRTLAGSRHYCPRQDRAVFLRPRTRSRRLRSIYKVRLSRLWHYPWLTFIQIVLRLRRQ